MRTSRSSSLAVSALLASVLHCLHAEAPGVARDAPAFAAAPHALRLPQQRATACAPPRLPRAAPGPHPTVAGAAAGRTTAVPATSWCARKLRPGRRLVAPCAVAHGGPQETQERKGAAKALEVKDTIYAQSTAVGMGGIAVIRVSGPSALAALQRLSKAGAKVPKARYATLRTLIDPETLQALDSSLVLFFPGPKSFTGEDVVEIHCHGGTAIVTSVLEALGSCEGLRLAQRGEFTKRAYLNGNMDLLEAEALNDLIHAETRGQQQQAMQQMAGAHKKIYQRWRTDLVKCVAHVNAFIDYGDNDGIEEAEVMVPTREMVQATMKEMRRHLADGRRGESIRSG